MNKFGIGSIIVMNSHRDRPIGILTDRDILQLLESHPELLLLQVKDVKSQPIQIIGPHISIEHAVQIMASKNIKRLPVNDGERLIGIISLSDITKASPLLINVLFDLLKEKL